MRTELPAPPARSERRRLLSELDRTTDPKRAAYLSSRVSATFAEHEQVAVRRPQHGVVYVDVLMAPLLKRLWAHGLSTRYSCQGDYSTDDRFRNRLAYIMFDGERTARLFADAAIEHVGLMIHVEEASAGRSTVRFHPNEVTLLGQVWGT